MHCHANACIVTIMPLLTGGRAAANPWGDGATTLEWSLSSPPPFHTYDELPEVT
jgi:cytochrome c oxidase subunit 1